MNLPNVFTVKMILFPTKLESTALLKSIWVNFSKNCFQLYQVIIHLQDTNQTLIMEI